VILDYYGCELCNVSGHVAVHHKVSGSLGELEVNSFHNQACLRVEKPMEILAQTEDGVIEAVCDKEKHILVTMWHPEREQPFTEEDKKRVQELFG
jgi:putative glutamine amidotransferase